MSFSGARSTNDQLPSRHAHQLNPDPIAVHTSINTPAVMSGNHGNTAGLANRHRQERFQDYIARTMQHIRANVSEQELANLGLNSLVNQYMGNGNVEAGHPESAQAGVATDHGHTHAHMPGQAPSQANNHRAPTSQNAPQQGQFVINIGGGGGGGNAGPDINQNGGPNTQVIKLPYYHSTYVHYLYICLVYRMCYT